jgi:hypothetical protein
LAVIIPIRACFKRVLLLATVIALGSSSCLSASEEAVKSGRDATAALEVVSVGMPFEEAILRLRASEGFWRQNSCGYSIDQRSGVAFTNQMFYYGSRDLKMTHAVWIRAVGAPGHERLEVASRLSVDLIEPWFLGCKEVVSPDDSRTATMRP